MLELLELHETVRLQRVPAVAHDPCKVTNPLVDGYVRPSMRLSSRTSRIEPSRRTLKQRDQVRRRESKSLISRWTRGKRCCTRTKYSTSSVRPRLSCTTPPPVIATSRRSPPELKAIEA